MREYTMYTYAHYMYACNNIHCLNFTKPVKHTYSDHLWAIQWCEVHGLFIQVKINGCKCPSGKVVLIKGECLTVYYTQDYIH